MRKLPLSELFAKAKGWHTYPYAVKEAAMGGNMGGTAEILRPIAKNLPFYFHLDLLCFEKKFQLSLALQNLCFEYL